MILDAKALAGRTVLLTGASGGIGQVTAQALAAAGATVLAHYRSNRSGAQRALAGVPAERAVLLAGDLDTPDAARRLWHQASAAHQVDVLVLNAGVIPDTPVDGPDEEWDAGWQQALQVNVIVPGALMREAVRAFAARGSGTVIVLSSWAAEQGSRIRDVSSYAASKAAIRNLAQTFARAYARDGVRVHIVAPGVVNAGMGVAGQDDTARSAVAAGLAMGRYVEPEEVASLIAFLAADDCPSLTGATVDINGASYIR
jgi:NAD(P)-dependent dehydrogenase (short-subunit alcohol dehydrogenase family)